MPNVFLGIDPGMSGGLAMVGLPSFEIPPIGNDRCFLISMPKTERDVWDWFSRLGGWVRTILDEFHPFAVIEKVHSMPGQGVSSTFKFGKIYGFLRACLVASGIPFEEVPPRTWQKALGIPCRAKTETGTQWKNRLKQVAQQLFPQENITLATADALLIAEFCRRKHGAKP